MKKSGALLMILGFVALGLLAGRTALADDGVIDRAGNGIKKGAEAAAHGIDKGVKAAKPAIKKGGKWLGQELKKVGKKIEKAADK
jgi:hypothetical protein